MAKDAIEEKIRSMNFHDEISLDGGRTNILRVHKGWIYTFTKKMHCNGVGDQIVMTSVFVPR